MRLSFIILSQIAVCFQLVQFFEKITQVFQTLFNQTGCFNSLKSFLLYLTCSLPAVT